MKAGESGLRLSLGHFAAPVRKVYLDHPRWLRKLLIMLSLHSFYCIYHFSQTGT